MVKFVSYFNLHKLNLSPLESRLQHYRLQKHREGSTHVATYVEEKKKDIRREMKKNGRMRVLVEGKQNFSKNSLDRQGRWFSFECLFEYLPAFAPHL